MIDSRRPGLTTRHCRAQRDAQHPWGRRGGAVACAACQKMSGGEAVSFWALGPVHASVISLVVSGGCLLPWALNRVISPVLFLGTVVSSSPLLLMTRRVVSPGSMVTTCPACG